MYIRKHQFVVWDIFMPILLAYCGLSDIWQYTLLWGNRAATTTKNLDFPKRCLICRPIVAPILNTVTCLCPSTDYTLL